MPHTIETDLDAEGLADAMAIRRAVFTDEQGIPAPLDVDGEDAGADHVLIRDGNVPVATGRLVCASATEGVLARIAVVVSHRGQGLGRRVVAALEARAAARGLAAVSLKPHEHLKAFYASMGYTVVGGVEMVGGHSLITMRKALDRP